MERGRQLLHAEEQAEACFSQSAYVLMSVWQLLEAALIQPSRHVSLASHSHASMQLTIVAQSEVTAA